MNLQQIEYKQIVPGIKETDWFDVVEEVDNQLNYKEGKMDVEKFVKPTGMYLKAEDVKKNPAAAFVIQTEGEMETSEKFGTEKIAVDGDFAGEQKRFSMSKTNARVVSAKLGNDTKDWVKHKLFLELYRTKTSDGKMTDAINIARVE